MLKRKSSAPNKAPRSRKSHSAAKAEAKTAPVRRRFVISSKASGTSAKPPDANWKIKVHAVPAAAGNCRPTASRTRRLPRRRPIHGGFDRDDQDAGASRPGTRLRHLRRHQRCSAGQFEPRRSRRAVDQAAQPGRGNCHGPGRGRARRPHQAARSSRKKPRTIRAWKFWTTRFACI